MDFTNFIVEGNKSFNQEKVSRNFACFTRVTSKSTNGKNVSIVLLYVSELYVCPFVYYGCVYVISYKNYIQY